MLVAALLRRADRQPAPPAPGNQRPYPQLVSTIRPAALGREDWGDRPSNSNGKYPNDAAQPAGIGPASGAAAGAAAGAGQPRAGHSTEATHTRVAGAGAVEAGESSAADEAGRAALAAGTGRSPPAPAAGRP